jgi:hypothetical protein
VWVSVRCDCGVVKRVRGQSLVDGLTLSCGHGCMRLHPKTPEEIETGNRSEQPGCVCWHCTSARWESGHAAQ